MGAECHPEATPVVASSLEITSAAKGVEWTVSWVVTSGTIGGSHSGVSLVTPDSVFLSLSLRHVATSHSPPTSI